MAAGDRHPALRTRNVNEHSLALAREWKRLGRAATFVALLTSPVLFVSLVVAFGWAWYWAALGAFGMIVVFRGAVDVLAHKLIPAPTIYGAESELAKDDVISRRRLWYWRKKFRRTFLWGTLFLLVARRSCAVLGRRRPRRRRSTTWSTAIPEALAAAPRPSR